LRSIKIKYFSPDGATKANDFLYTGILAVLLTHNFYIKRTLLPNIVWQKSSAFARIYLLASIMYCNLFWGETATCFFAKITRVVFLDSGVEHDYLCT